MKRMVAGLLIVVSSCLALCACAHKHEYSSEWSSDETAHWHAAVCEHTDEFKDREEHVFIDGKCKCGREQTVNAVLTLDAGEGGTFEDGGSIKTLEAKAGQSVSELLSAVKVTAKEGLTFEGWYIGNEKLDAQEMPQTGLALRAKYLASGTVKVYKQDEFGGYPDFESVAVQGFFGEPFEYFPYEEHYTVDYSKENTLFSKSLSAGEEFSVFLKREKYEVRYYDVLKDGSISAVAVDAVYGQYVLEENLFSAEDGRRFAGWSDEENGAPEYKPQQEIPLEKDLILYAIWDEAYTDRAGGGDYIYLPQGNPGEAILDRAGIEFTGKANGETFTIEYKDAVLSGKVNENGTFMYENAMEAGKYIYYDRYYRADGSSKTDDQITLTLNKYGEGTLSLDGESYEGVCFCDLVMGDYVFAIDEENAVYFTCGKQDNTLYFSIQNGEFGTYPEYVSATGFLQGYPGDGQITLDGYGGAVYVDTYYKETYQGYYNINFDQSYASPDGRMSILCVNLHLYDHDGWIFGERGQYQSWVDRTIYCLDLDGTILYVYENVSAKGEFTGAEGTLTLDGYGGYSDSAVLKNGDSEISGNYFAYESEVFGTVVEFTQEDNTTVCFRLNGEEKTFEKLGGKITEMVRLHTDDYGRSEFGEPILVMYSEEDGKIPAEVYVDQYGDFECAVKGYCSIETLNQTEVYTFESEEVLLEEQKPFESIVFIVDRLFDNNERLVIAYYVFETDGTEDYQVFTGAGANSGETIWAVSLGYNGAGAFYQTKDGILSGSFTYSNRNEWFEGDDEYAVFRYVNEDKEWEYFYFELQGEESKTFTQIEFLPYRLTSTDETYNYWYENFCIDASGRAQFQAQDDYENPLGVVEGSYSSVGQTVCGDEIYRFEPEANEWNVTAFDFVIENDYIYSYSHGIALTQDVYHLRESERKTEFETADGGTLQGDGFWMRGIYTDRDGNSYTGLMYNGRYEDLGKVIIFEMSEFTVLFDILDDGRIDMRDGADGYYKLLNDNSQNVNKWAIELDGHGRLRVFDDSVYDYTYSGTYAETEEYGIYLITIDMGSGMTLEFEAALLSSSGSSAAVIVNKEGRGLYVAEDLSVLYIDGLNTECWYIDPAGIGHMGDYYLFEDGFGAFNTIDGSEVIPFLYDIETKTFEKLDLSQYAGTFYTNDLCSSYSFATTVTTDGYAGYYRVDGENIVLYLLSEYSGEITVKRGTLKDGVLTVDYKEYVNISGKKLTLTGNVTLSGETKKEDLVLEFTPGTSLSVRTDATLEGKGNMQIGFSGRYLWLYVNGEMLELDVDLERGSFTIVCEYEYEYNSLEEALS